MRLKGGKVLLDTTSIGTIDAGFEIVLSDVEFKAILDKGISLLVKDSNIPQPFVIDLIISGGSESGITYQTYVNNDGDGAVISLGFENQTLTIEY